MQGGQNCGKIYTEINSKRKEENMKKIALFSLVMCLCGVYAVPAFATCGASALGFDGNQDPDDDEFLYESNKQFELAKQGYKNSNHQNSGDGKGIECDTTNSAGCGSDKVIDLLPGHVFKGKVVNAKKRYQCTHNFWGNDMWVEVGGKCETQWGDLEIGKAWKNVTTAGCSGLNKTENNVDTVKLWEVICREGGLVICKPMECVKGYKLDIKNGKCIRDCKGDCDDKPKTCEEQYAPNMDLVACCKAGQDVVEEGGYKKCKCKDKSKEWNSAKRQCEKKSVPVDPIKQKTCKEQRTTVEGKACCDIPESEAKWDGKNCKCIDQNAEFKIVNGKGQCVVKDQPVEPVEPVVDGDCIYYFTGSIECANGNQYFEQVAIRLPKSKIAQECGTNIVNTDVTRVMELMQKLCKPAGNTNPVINPVTPSGPSQDEINRAQKKLEAFTSSAKDNASVWKTAEGKFNTTRLATDLTAGVVLGTVGGVVTGVVIKKNQVKKGFEALHCTVGGQKVADWGDEFSIGLNR